MNENGEDAIAIETGGRTLDGDWGYACVEGDAVFIPVVQATPDWPLRRVLAHLHAETHLRRFVFSAVLNPDELKSHLRHVVKEWDEFVPYLGDYSHCIEIAYEPKGGA